LAVAMGSDESSAWNIHITKNIKSLTCPNNSNTHMHIPSYDVPVTSLLSFIITVLQ